MSGRAGKGGSTTCQVSWVVSPCLSKMRRCLPFLPQRAAMSFSDLTVVGVLFKPLSLF